MTLGGKDLNLIPEGALNLPLSDKLLSRLSFRVQRRDGYGINEVSGNDVDDARQYAGRAQLNFIPSVRFSFLATGEYYREKDHAFALKFLHPSFPDNPPGFTALGLGGIATGKRNIRLRPGFEPSNFKETWYTTGTARWHLGSKANAHVHHELPGADDHPAPRLHHVRHVRPQAAAPAARPNQRAPRPRRAPAPGLAGTAIGLRVRALPQHLRRLLPHGGGTGGQQDHPRPECYRRPPRPRPARRRPVGGRIRGLRKHHARRNRPLVAAPGGTLQRREPRPGQRVPLCRPLRPDQPAQPRPAAAQLGGDALRQHQWQLDRLLPRSGDRLADERQGPRLLHLRGRVQERERRDRQQQPELRRARGRAELRGGLQEHPGAEQGATEPGGLLLRAEERPVQHHASDPDAAVLHHDAPERRGAGGEGVRAGAALARQRQVPGRPRRHVPGLRVHRFPFTEPHRSPRPPHAGSDDAVHSEPGGQPAAELSEVAVQPQRELHPSAGGPRNVDFRGGTSPTRTASSTTSSTTRASARTRTRCSMPRSALPRRAGGGPRTRGSRTSRTSWWLPERSRSRPAGRLGAPTCRRGASA